MPNFIAFFFSLNRTFYNERVEKMRKKNDNHVSFGLFTCNVLKDLGK